MMMELKRENVKQNLREEHGKDMTTKILRPCGTKLGGMDLVGCYKRLTENINPCDETCPFKKKVKINANNRSRKKEACSDG